MLSATAKDAHLYYECKGKPMLVTVYAGGCPDNVRWRAFKGRSHLVIGANALQNGSLGSIHHSGVCDKLHKNFNFSDDFIKIRFHLPHFGKVS